MMPLTSQSIRNLLEIKDPNINFFEDSYFEFVDDVEALIIAAVLTYTPEHCLLCGFGDQIVKYGFNVNLIMVPSSFYRAIYLRLRRQRFKCFSCGHTFDARTDYVRSNYQISEPLRQLILIESSRNQANTDIADRFHISDKTVQRVVDEEVTNHKKHTREWLPEHLSFDEFKSVGSLVSFIWADSNSHNIGEILYRRTSRHLARYFSGFSDSARRNVKTVSLDLNAGYINLVPQLFPNADIVVDRFHIIQMCTRALNQIRVQVMKSLNQRDKKYRFMKQEWKQFLRPFNQLEMSTPKYHYSVGYYETDLNLVTECLELDEGFKAAYDTYQEILEAFHNKDTEALSQILKDYKVLHNKMDQPIKSFKKYKKQVLNAVESPYSNGFIEGLIGRIKKIKNAAYGYRNWMNFRNRVYLELLWLPNSRNKKAKEKTSIPIMV